MKKLSLIIMSIAAISVIWVSCGKEESQENVTTYENHMEHVGKSHNTILHQIHSKGCEELSVERMVECAIPDQIANVNFINNIVSNLGQPETNRDEELEIELPDEIVQFLDQNPVLWDFHNDLLELTSHADEVSLEDLIAAINELESIYAPILAEIDLDAMASVGSVARHSAEYWKEYNEERASHISRYMMRDWAAAWTVGVVSIWFPGVGLGAAVAASAVSSATTDL
jgi:hypothetical protein